MSQTILVGYDGSESAARAARKACELAVLMGAKVKLLHVVRFSIPPAGLPMLASDTMDELIRYGDCILRQAKQELAPLNATMDTALLVGAPADVLTHQAENPEVTVVLVGRTGKGAAARLILGSVTQRLAHICPKPLFIIP